MNYKNSNSPPGLTGMNGGANAYFRKNTQANALGVLADVNNKTELEQIYNKINPAANASRALNDNEKGEVETIMNGLGYLIINKDWNEPPPGTPPANSGFGSWNTAENIKLIRDLLKAMRNLNGGNLPGVSKNT